MGKDRISELTMDFAVEIVRLSQALEDRHEYVLSRQIRSSGGSVGANVRESKYAQSKADFVSKLQIALKEAAETDFWLELLFRTAYIDREQYRRPPAPVLGISVPEVFVAVALQGLQFGTVG